MLMPDAYSTASVVAVCAYYGVAWMWMFRTPARSTIVPIYAPPEKLSPAKIRYLWKRTFDERTFWAAVLNLVAKGLATITSGDSGAVLHLTPAANLKVRVSDEEELMLRQLKANGPRKGTRLSMLDARTQLTMSRMADLLRRETMGVWLRENRQFLMGGFALSILAVCIAARPHDFKEWLALAWSFAVMVPSAYYLPFLLLRLRDLYRTARDKFDMQIIRRAAAFLAWLIPCVAGLALGLVELGNIFGWPVLAVTALMTTLGITFLHFVRTPTPEGQKLLDEIEGFRLFLREVDRYPMNHSEAPHNQPGVYEQFLPYAVALEVEQAWSNRFLAMASTFHCGDQLPGTESFYLGMWDGKPVEILYHPEARQRY
jgi:Predicted membrane protein (DUF2207) C-terminal domain